MNTPKQPVSYKDLSLADLTSLINLGDPEAVTEIASRYLYGSGVPKNPEQASRWLQKAAEQENGQTQTPEQKTAEKTEPSLRETAFHTAVLCVFLIAAILCVFAVVPQNTFRNAHLKKITKKAEQGDPAAQFELGVHYEADIHDKNEAVRWFRKSAEQGNAHAQQALTELKANR